MELQTENVELLESVGEDYLQEDLMNMIISIERNGCLKIETE